MQLDDIEQAESHRDSEAGKRAELQWLPRGTEAGSVRDSRGVPSFDLLSLDFEALFEEVVELLSACCAAGAVGASPACAHTDLRPSPLLSADAHHAELDRLDKRYFVDRVYDRAQILERCRRIYEMEPLDERAAYQEALDLLMSFQQLNENHFTVTNMVAARAEEREAQMGDLVRAGPIQSLPDATDLAIADIALYLEYERELLLQSVKEKHLMAQAQEAAQRAREEAEREAHVAMAETALRERLSIQDIALAGVRVEHVREAVKRLKDEPLPLDYAQMLRNAAIITTELQQ